MVFQSIYTGPNLVKFKTHLLENSCTLKLSRVSPETLSAGGIDPVVRGLISHPAKLNKQDGVLVNEVKEKLYAFTSQIAQDLGALNLQRGRDHGLPSKYTHMHSLWIHSQVKSTLFLENIYSSKQQECCTVKMT